MPSYLLCLCPFFSFFSLTASFSFLILFSSKRKFLSIYFSCQAKVSNPLQMPFPGKKIVILKIGRIGYAAVTRTSNIQESEGWV
jgi:hypothetical protein